jgi:FixJ family two-component response regulator/signal transduction histidine kinase
MPTLAPRDASASNQELVEFERLLADLSAGFINLPAAELDGALTDALRRIVELLAVDRCQLIRLSLGGDDANITQAWAVEGVAVAPRRSIASDFPWAVGRIRAGRAVVVPRLDDLPAEAAVDKASWLRIGVHSHLSMPMIVAGQVEGILALGCLRRERAWPEGLVSRIQVLAKVFASAMAHKQAEEDLAAAMRFERVVSDTLAALLGAGRSQLDSVIGTGLRDIAHVFGVERATLWQRAGDSSEFTKTHRWQGDGLSAPPDSTVAFDLPWIAAQLVGGSVVHFGRHAELPPEANSDLPALRALGTGAAVIVPLVVAGSVAGALSLATSRERPDWPPAPVGRVKLLGEVFAGVLERGAAERREQEARAQAAHAARVGMMGSVAASLVHELTQPLAASLANAETAAELLAARAPDLDELRATVADIVADDRRAGDLIQQLRRFLRRGAAERSELDLRQLIEEVIHFLASEAASKDVEIVFDCTQELPTFVGDRVQIQQVLMNLLLNGFDAVAAKEPGTRRVLVLARPSEAAVVVEVTDQGCGMDEATVARVFQPFFTTKPKGMGLGLSISQTIVAAHGGTLIVRSALGRGTTFRIELPSRPPDAIRPTPIETVASKSAGTIFVIDDDPSMRRALQRQLRGAGHRVEAFESAQGYLEHAVPEGVACIVSDVRMPGLSGLDLQDLLAQGKRDLPIVFVSGHGDIPSTVRAMRAGAVSFLTKPFTKDELLAAVAVALARSRAIDDARLQSAALQARYESLTPRESEVFALVVQGRPNKLIADRLGAAEATIKIHRGRVMEKMGAASLADLVRMAQRLGLQHAHAPSPG